MTELRQLGEEIRRFALDRTAVREKFLPRLRGAERSACAFYVAKIGSRLYTYLSWWDSKMPREVAEKRKNGKKTRALYLGPWEGTEEERRRLRVMSEKYTKLYEETKRQVMAQAG